MSIRSNLRLDHATILAWEALLKAHKAHKSQADIRLTEAFRLGYIEDESKDVYVYKDIPMGTEVALFRNMNTYRPRSHRPDKRTVEGTFFLPEEGLQISVLDDGGRGRIGDQQVRDRFTDVVDLKRETVMRSLRSSRHAVLIG